MTLPKVGNVSGAAQVPTQDAAKERFGQVFEAQKGRASEVGPRRVVGGPAGPQPAQRVDPGCTAGQPGVKAVQGTQRALPAATPRAVEAAKVLDQVASAQQRLDRILELAQSGKSFTPAELIALQAQVYRASQELDLAGKVVEKATGGVKQILQTQL